MIEQNRDAIRKDFNKNPVEGVNGNATEDEIAEKIEKYGIFSHAYADAPVTVKLWDQEHPEGS